MTGAGNEQRPLGAACSRSGANRLAWVPNRELRDMTVAELIRTLQAMPPAALVVTYAIDGSGEYDAVDLVERVTVRPAQGDTGYDRADAKWSVRRRRIEAVVIA